MSSYKAIGRRLRKGVVATTLGVASLLPLVGHADLIEYKFTTPAGEVRTLPSGTTHVNPTGTMAFALSAGLDRKVRVSILDASDAVLESNTSHLLGADDRINVDGKEYYGARLHLPAPPEGRYKIKSEIVASDGSTVNTEVHDFFVDTTPPSVSGDFYWRRWGYYHRQHTDGKWIVSYPHASDAGFKDVTDSGSGLHHAQFTSVFLDGPKAGQIYADKVVANITADNRVIIGNESQTSINAKHFPSHLGEMRWHYDIHDRAGNTTRVTEDVYVASKGPSIAPEPVAVYTGSANTYKGVSGFDPYTKGMAIHNNPVKIMYRVPRSEYYGGGGAADIYGAWARLPSISSPNTSAVIAQDNEYLYLAIEGVTDGKLMDATKNFITGTTSYQVFSFDMDVTFASEALRPPTPGKLEAYIAGLNQWVGSSHNISKGNTGGSNDAITKVRLPVEKRPYLQKFNLVFNRNGKHYNAACEVPSGGEVCLIEGLNLPYPGDDVDVYHSRFVVTDETGVLRSRVVSPSLKYDGSPASFTTFSNNTKEKRFHYGALNDYKQRVWSHSEIKVQNIIFKNKSTSTEEIIAPYSTEVESISSDEEEHWASFRYSSIADGNYEVYAYIEDGFGGDANNKQRIKLIDSLFVDATPPNVEIKTIKAGSVASLDDVLIKVSDSVAISPKIKEVNLAGGPATDNVFLTVRAVSDNEYKLEYPIMFPSLSAGEEYTLTVTAEDDQSNIATESITFLYEPPLVSLLDGNGKKLMIPAVPHEFRHANGRRIIESEPLTLADGATVAGTYDVFASLRSDAEVSLIVNGMRIDPGVTNRIMSQHDFGNSGGRLSLSLAAAEQGIVGASSLLISTSAPNAPVLVQDFQTWKGGADLASNNWSPRQVIDPINITVKADSTTFCSFTTRESESRQADPITDPVCFFEWDQLPEEIQPVERRAEDDAIPEVAGVATRQGAQTLAYSLYMFDSHGNKVSVGEGSQTLTVQPALGSIQYATRDNYAAVHRVIHDFDLRLNQTEGPECIPTLTENIASRTAERNGIDPTRRSCYFTWEQLPTGLNQEANSDSPLLVGNIASNGDHTLSWTAYTFSPGGYRVPVAQQSERITIVDPEAPTIDLLSEYHHEGNTYLVPQNSTSLGGLTVEGVPTDIRLDIWRGSEQIENEVYTPGWGATNRLVRNLRTNVVPLWSEVTHAIKASYERVPDINSTAEYIAIATPSADIQPLIYLDSTKVLDTEPLSVTVKIRSLLDMEGDYIPDEMGEWNVQLFNQKTYSDLEPLTEKVKAENGEMEFALELSRLSDAGLRIVAQAELISPIADYERIVTSRPTFVQVLRGGAIPGEITSRYFTGPAPLTSIFQVSLEDRLDQQALGDVVWQLSQDGGATWEDQIGDERRKMQFYKAFDEGTYLLRAYMNNRHSGEESYTEQVEITAYTQPDVTIEGPSVLFVGDSYTYQANVTVPDSAVKTAADAVVEWSLDGGDTWPHSGRSLALSSDTEQRFTLQARVRMPEAPETDRHAYREDRTMVSFRNILAPRVRVRSDTLMEEGNTYTVRVNSGVPYRGVEYDVKGYFTLPDGSTRTGTEIEYVPTVQDALAGRATFTYTAWVDGFKEETLATGSSVSRVWQYIWPDFYVTERISAPVAPATIAMTIRHRNGVRNLDTPVYEWSLPEGAQDVQARGDKARIFTMAEPGTYHVNVKVTDARDHTEIIHHTIELGVPDPYNINFRYTPSNEYMREPLDVRLRPIYRGGHPHDRVSNQRFRINGEVVSEGANAAVATLPIGHHSVTFEIETNHGVQAEETIFIDVAANQVPTCELDLSESSRYWIVTAECQDVDGRLAGYHWMVDGVENDRTTNRLGILKQEFNNQLPHVLMIAVDDSGGASDPITVQ